MDNELYVTEETFNNLNNLTRALLNEDGKEVHNPEPKVMHTSVNRPPTLAEQIQRVIRTQVSQQAAEQGHETFAESMDLDIPEDNSDDTEYTILSPEHPIIQALTTEPEVITDEPETSTETIQTVDKTETPGTGNPVTE